ncbi:geranylgeranylglycerol-phosphate geranylgeranyltransferase [Sediminibacterium soli]|uniref:geranylgeranylglycerol-phosphate geranylgeranyltransferase n=1 Tax=Sediminibacterium soli TaxID=2698829 RepID=UPI0013796E31|nr:geranylgeranylglycerol-phosphate geranylgeranyltransferase [Sediminibacterium soli]NCI47076.1 ubiquinone biosynthesis protein UbiA [Sediminibacterium soli]
MKTIAAFLRLVRWPNLVFIALTQLLFECCIFRKAYSHGMIAAGENRQFVFLCLASLLIAAAGYIINDYFDLNIDQVNKPDKVVVNVLINRRWVIFWHMFLSLMGLFFTVLALPIAQYWHLVLANIASIVLLWFYSTNFKKQLLIGNIIISLMTAWVIGILFLAKYPFDVREFLRADQDEIRFFRLTVVYTCFAFVISLIREVIKDMEDMEGDRKYNCRTMPIVWGLNASKVFVAVWIIVLVAALTILQLYVLPFGWWHSALYCMLFIVAPLVWILARLFKAQTPEAFHRLSSAVKMVMLTGILSMVFFGMYYS